MCILISFWPLSFIDLLLILWELHILFRCYVIFTKICKTIRAIFCIIALCFRKKTLVLSTKNPQNVKYELLITPRYHNFNRILLKMRFYFPKLGLIKIIYRPMQILGENVEDIKSKIYLPHHTWVKMNEKTLEKPL